MKTRFPVFLFFLSFFFSCQKEITVDLPTTKPKIVVEGHIEPGLPPWVVLTRSMGYFEPTDLATMQNMFVRGAKVSVSDGITSGDLMEFCDLPDSLLEMAAQFTGIPTEDLKNFNYCIYTTFNPLLFGVLGRTYNLTVNADSVILSASTLLPVPIPLDSVWFKLQAGFDSLGFAWAHLSDPSALGNAYRWFARRLNGGGEPFIAPFSSAFDDKFINGLSFDFAYDKGHHPNEEDQSTEAHLYSIGDTIVVKFCTLDRASYIFYRSLDRSFASNNNPFASPAYIQSNITGGLGIWGGYGVSYDTIYAK